MGRLFFINGRRALFPVAETTTRGAHSPDFMTSLAGLMGVVLAEIDYFPGGFLVTVLAVPEKVGVTFMAECYVSVF